MWVQEIWCKSSNLCTDLGNYTLMYVCFTCWLVGWLVGCLFSQSVSQTPGRRKCGNWRQVWDNSKRSTWFSFFSDMISLCIQIYTHTCTYMALCCSVFSFLCLSSLPSLPLPLLTETQKTHQKNTVQVQILTTFPSSALHSQTAARSHCASTDRQMHCCSSTINKKLQGHIPYTENTDYRDSKLIK